jgi:peptidyl-tRNA hydrolase
VNGDHKRVLSHHDHRSQVLCVNDALKMGKGKIGAQCAHAACGIVQKYRVKQEVALLQWEYGGQAKIALRVADDVEMVRVCSLHSVLAGTSLFCHHLMKFFTELCCV